MVLNILWTKFWKLDFPVNMTYEHYSSRKHFPLTDPTKIKHSMYYFRYIIELLQAIVIYFHVFQGFENIQGVPERSIWKENFVYLLLVEMCQNIIGTRWMLSLVTSFQNSK